MAVPAALLIPENFDLAANSVLSGFLMDWHCFYPSNLQYWIFINATATEQPGNDFTWKLSEIKRPENISSSSRIMKTEQDSWLRHRESLKDWSFTSSIQQKPWTLEEDWTSGCSQPIKSESTMNIINIWKPYCRGG